ncbi:serine hydrolase [Nonomuraea angiospora]|uniref:serine hydrolase n=1 Tax=Nonomuraea angiospora TaxID=46172 RepID=UPI00178C08C2|nr:serine hydrolase [Nonomuraea angiospora]
MSFAAARIEPDGQCRIAHGLDADTQRPIGSAFKLYVLGALAQAVAEGRLSWNERLAIRDDHKSLPSGTLQNRPAGTMLALSEYADHMISISDNTATDHLIHRLGRDAVRRQLSLFGHREPDANVPILTTKAFFQLKAASDQDRTRQYLALPAHRRTADGRALATSLMVSDPTTAPDTIDVAAKGQSIVRGAFHLLAL